MLKRKDLIMLLSKPQFPESLFIFQNLDRLPRAGGAKSGTGGARGRGGLTIQKAYTSSVSHGREPDTRPPEQAPEQVEGSIDPGKPVPNEAELEKTFPHLKTIIDEMRKIDAEEYGKVAAQINIQDQAKLSPILEKIEAAILYRAVLENWNTQTLYSRYRSALGRLYNEISTGNPLKTSLYFASGVWSYLEGGETINFNEINPHIKARPNQRITPEKRGNFYKQLMNIETKLFNQYLACKNWDSTAGRCSELRDRKKDIYWDKYLFYKERIIPFERLMLTDTTIMENLNPEEVRKRYSEIIQKLYRHCIL